MKLDLLTANYGQYDSVKPLPEGITGLLITDDPDWVREQGAEAKGWEVRHEPHSFESEHGDPAIVGPMLAHKYWKTHPHEILPDSEGWIWLDSSVQPYQRFFDWAGAAIEGVDWAMVRHPWRTCIYTEAEYSASLDRYKSMADSLRRQAAWYREMGHPANYGLPATGVSIRRNTPMVRAVSEHWWDECLQWSHQDQVSLPVLQRLFEDRVRFDYNLGWGDGWDLWPHLR